MFIVGKSFFSETLSTLDIKSRGYLTTPFKDIEFDCFQHFRTNIFIWVRKITEGMLTDSERKTLEVNLHHLFSSDASQGQAHCPDISCQNYSHMNKYLLLFTRLLIQGDQK